MISVVSEILGKVAARPQRLQRLIQITQKGSVMTPFGGPKTFSKTWNKGWNKSGN